MEIKKSPSLLKVDEVGADRRWLQATNGGGGGGHDAAFKPQVGGGANHASQPISNEWADDVDTNPYEYPQVSSSIDTTANSN